MASTSRWSKFVLLLWKNWIIQKRHYIQTLFEILIPVLCCAMLIIVRGLVDPEQVLEPTIFERLSIGLVNLDTVFPPVTSTVAYSPQNAVLEQFLTEAIDQEINSLRQIRLVSAENAREMESLLMQNNYIGGIEFPDSYAGNTDLPQTLQFALRLPSELRFTGWTFGNWRTNFMVVPFVQGLRNANQSDGGSPNYLREGFLALQAAISRTFIRRQQPDYTPPEVSLRRYPYPPYYEDLVLVAMERLLPMIILISFFYTCINTVKFITIEKEKQLKEAMKIMGLPNWLHWTAWFVRCLILLLITISLLVFLISANLTSNTDLSVIEYADWSVLWFFFLTYVLVTICFCFMMSVFFNKANTAAGIAGLLWFLFAIPFNVAVQNYDEMALGTKIVSSLLSNTAMSFGIMNIIRLEGNQEGLQWSNLFSSPTMGDDFSVGLVMVMFLVDALLYLAIALYFEQVMPGEFGVAKPWNFLFTRDFWKRNRIEDGSVGAQSDKMDTSPYFEQEPHIDRIGVRIVNLRKTYGKKVAVEGLNLNMYDGQITVLLGHNGAGKTTTMSMLTGMFSPSSGTALVNGYDIRKDIEGVRFSLGLCPQHNVLFNELTVAEHLQFFAQLKGISRDKTADEVDKYVNLLELTDKRHAQSNTLSGGMKRKLGVGIALCGGSRVVLLDEPTSGMDPSARRALWDLIQKEKIDRTVILSTHFMDEADVLGDRIAIMAEGKLRAVGSPFFLKKNLGAGYRLICVKEAHCDREQVLSILRRYIPDVRIETDIGTELSFVLREDYLKVFQPMLEVLEEQMGACGISSYGISLTTMEEVFLRAGSDSYNAEETQPNGGNGYIDIDQNSDNYSLEGLPLLDGSRRLFQQIYAQFYKKFLTTVRSWITLTLQFAIPVLFVLMSYLIFLNSSAGRELPELPMNFDRYTGSLTVLEVGDPGAASVGDAYKARFSNEPAVHQLNVIQEDMTTYILNRTAQDIASFNARYWVGATVGSANCTAWFNNKAYHSASLAVHLIYNAILQSICPTCQLEVSNKPLPYRLDTQLQRLETGANAGFQLAFNTGFAMAFVSALFILFYIKERTTRAKLLQFVSGVNVALFWSISFLWDYLVFVVASLFYIVTLAIIQQDGWSTFDQLGRAFLVLLFYAFSSLPVTYLFAYMFHVPATGFVKMMLLNVLSGTIFFTAVSLLRFDGIDLENVANVLEWIFMFFPSFVLTQSMNALNMVGGREAVCNRACEQITICTEELKCLLVPQCCGTTPFTFDQQTGINRSLLFFVGIGVAGFCAILIIDYRLIKKIFSRKTASVVASEERRDDQEDSDVLEEKRKIASSSEGELSSYNLVLKDLSKTYGKFVAVNKLSVGVRHSECFGLLGINGAGKTSTFKMMTGDENITSGDAWVNGINLRTDMNRVHQHIGYCPQFDALLEDLTGRETLYIFALMRGVHRSEINGVSLTLAEELNFGKHLDKRTKAYSGGNKRKLSTALALMGNPSVVYLDEPTTGMDPGAKRQFWNVICKVRNSGKSIVLTSHSMEECEALCTRLAIMVNGEFKCLGSTQHLKNKFSEGFLLTVKTKRQQANAAEQVKSFVMSKFEGAVLKEEYQDSLTFHIARTDQKWSAMFGLMESAKDRLGIEDYALGQTTLEQVFLFFTKYQRNVD